jgi:metallo-beta-lactamase family protein
VSSKEDSQAVTAADGPAIVISASGMCEAGRVLHHLKASLEDAKNCVMIVGFQAPHTLGRRLVEGRKRVKIFGVERDVRAQVVVMNGFSAHADRTDLLDYAERTRASISTCCSCTAIRADALSGGSARLQRFWLGRHAAGERTV